MSNTYKYQKQLSSLPMSNLNDASENLLNWIEPLVSTDKFNTTKSTLENFISKEGPILHKKLEEYSLQNDGNWLAPLWKDMYLDIREPVVIDVNYYVKIITEHLKDKYSATNIAGVIINKLTDIYESVADETFEPETIKNTPLCMDAYKEMFKATKIPKLNRDEYSVIPKSKTSHIIVMYKNHMFKLNLTDLNGNRYSYQMIVNTLNSLIDSKIEVNETSVGLLTTAYRDEAAILLEEIISVEQNCENFEVLKDALFMVCMDEDSKDLHEFGMSLIGTNENNRYFDKNLQLIFNQKGDFGFNLEHTGADAGPWIHIINIINEELHMMDKYTDDTSTQAIKIEQLTWKLNESVKTQLNDIRKKHSTKINDIHQEIIYFEDFGSIKIKSLKISPDAFLHLALQLAQYRTFGKVRSTYEATATRGYLKGRTECSRPISTELVKFIEVFEDNQTDTSTLKELMAASCKQHSIRIKECLGSDGVERYFFALKNMYTLFNEELGLEEMPKLFNDASYKELTYSFLSTSRIESKYFDLGGFGPVVSDGFGFWYNLLDNRIDMNLI
ncbi:choline/carnitine O-acyltransferase, partial [Arcobacteraceae bacterium]|nr:choline/carnitine O-acyltransferase [Arcobacteraceae bacterium]